MRLVVAVVAAVVVVARAEQAPPPVVRLRQGAIIGSREEATNGRLYYSFRSIPYARPPVGPLRFKDSEPAPSWSGVRNGSLPIPTCPQALLPYAGPRPHVGQEDCLYLNVYTPTVTLSNFPVMVYIHGGSFKYGSAEEYGLSRVLPAPLMQKDVVVVAINYRLGIFGFLSTEDSVLPGNQGLRDQTLALRWVQDNIRDLGGDPGQVTIFGVSAGGMSTHLHVLSPSSAGLFQRVILQSGTALLPVFSTSPRRNAIALGKALNCTGEESQQLLACFEDATFDDLMNAFIYGLERTGSTISPCVDGTFLPDHPAALLKAGRYSKVDIMSGATKDDGNTFTAGLFSEERKDLLQAVSDNFTTFLGSLMFKTWEEENSIYLARHMVFRGFHYKADFKLTLDDEPAATKLLSERYFQAPNMQVVESHAKEPSTKTFMYMFDHQPERSLITLYANVSQGRKTAGHGDDVMYLFEMPEALGPMTRPHDFHMQEILVTLWTNFASTGNPTVNGTLGFRWTPVMGVGPLQYLSLSLTPSMQTVDSEDREFWTSLPTKTNKLLYPERFLENTL